VFEERVFDDTDYTVCAFCFEKATATPIDVLFQPSGLKMTFDISEKYGWVLGQGFHRWLEGVGTKGVGRWTLENYKKGKKIESMQVVVNDPREEVIEETCNARIKNNIIMIRAIDTGTPGGRIKLFDVNEFGFKCLVGKNTSRNFASVKFAHPPELYIQRAVIKVVNRKLEQFRKKYNSVFLTAFRNSTEYYSRKRIGFDVVYRMIKKVLGNVN
jgi:hypothetical protein